MNKANLDWGNLSFGYMKTEGHLEYYFKNGKWSEARIVKEDILHIHMSATCLHYGQEAFEGLKAFEHKDGKVTVFRPDENSIRLNNSAKKILMEPVPKEIFLDAIRRVVHLNYRYVPPYGKGASLYIRPLLIGTSGLLGVRPAEEYMFAIFVSPVGPYFKEGLKPIDLYVEEEMKRAVPGGTGDVKVGGNYAAGLRASKKVKELGYKEVLYLDAVENRFLDESGPANFFGITQDEKYITPQSESILPSITNKSLMTLAKEELGLAVEKRRIEVEEVFNFSEAGCCGTAAVITPVRSITYRGKKVTYTDNDEPGPISKKLYKKLTSIQQGDEKDKYGWNMEIQND